MAKIQTESLEEIVREPKSGGFLEAIGGTQFLVAQFFTILATILGVYLAGYIGFQRTLEYDRFVRAQQKSHLLTALHEELKQNVVLLRKFNDRLPANTGLAVSPTDWPHLRLFVWQAAGRSPAAMDVPPQIMIDVQSFYEDVNDMLNDAEARDKFNHLSSDDTYFRTQYKKQETPERSIQIRRDVDFPRHGPSHGGISGTAEEIRIEVSACADQSIFSVERRSPD